MSSLQSKQHYNALDGMRFLCALMVVAIHTSFTKSLPFPVYFATMSVCSVSVPFFYACSGFFLFDRFTFAKNGKIEKSKENLRVMLRYEKRLAITYLIWTVIYFSLNIYRTIREGYVLKNYLLSMPKKFFLDGSEYHLWYVVCLLYAVPLLYLFLRYVGLKWIPVLMTVFFVIGQFQEGYSALNTPFHTFLQPAVNAMGYGFMVFSRAIPFLCVGMLLRKRPIECGRLLSISLAAICFLFGGAETYLIHRYINPDVNLRYNMFLLGTLFFLFAFLISLPQGSPKLTEPAAFLRSTSSLVYFIHPFIMRIYHFISSSESRFYFFIIAACSVLLSAGIVLLSKKLKFLRYIY